MGNYLIRTCKQSQSGYMAFSTPNVSPNDAGASEGIFKDYHENEYLIYLEDTNKEEMSYIINCIVMAERQLHINTIHLYVTVFDLDHYPSIHYDTSSTIYFPSSSDESGPLPDYFFQSSRFGKVLYPATLTTPQKSFQLLDPITFRPYTFRLNNQISGQLHAERCLQIVRNTTYGQPQKWSYYHCIKDNEVNIESNGTISLIYGTDLYSTRFKYFDYYMRFAAVYFPDNGINIDGFVTYKGFGTGKRIINACSDMKIAKRKWDSKSLNCRTSKNQLSRFIFQSRKTVEKMRWYQGVWGYNLDVAIPSEDIFTEQAEFVAQIIIWLLGLMPYLANGMTIDSSILSACQSNPNNFLIPETKYPEFIGLFHRLFAYYEYFLGIKTTIRSLLPTYSFPTKQNIDTYQDFAPCYVYPIGRLNIPDTDPRAVPMHQIRDRWWEWCAQLIEFQGVLAHLERLWHVRSFYKDQDRGHLTRRNLGHKDFVGHVVTRSPGESGINYPLVSRNTLSDQRMKANQRLPIDLMTPATRDIGSTKWIYWDTPHFEEVPILGGTYQYIAPVPATVPKQPRTWVWDHSIHPLTAEEEDAEAIALLEEVEENLRVTGKAVYGIAKQVVAAVSEGAIKLPPSQVANPFIDIAVDNINPTDRTKTAIPYTDYQWTDDGTIPTTFDGKKIEYHRPW